MSTFDEILEEKRARRRLPEPVVCRLLRRRHDLTQLEVAREVGVDRAAVARWELGQRRPRGETLDRYLAVLNRLAATER